MLSFLCQSLVSGVSFLSSLAILHYGKRDDYTAYVLVINGYVLLSSLMNAMLLQPLVTLSSKMSALAIRQSLNIGSVSSLLLGALGAFGLMGYALTQAAPSRPALPWILVAVCFCLLLFRDVQRSGWLLDSDLLNLFKLDSVYFSLALLALIAAVKFRYLGINGVLCAISLPALFGLVHRDHGTRQGNHVAFTHVGAAFWRALWHCSRWALPGVLVTWLFSNGYWFYLNSTEGKLAVAILAATRLAFTPIGLMVQGWSGYFRPVFSRLEHSGALAEKQAIIRRQNWICGGVALAYAAFLSLLGGLSPDFLPAYLRGGIWQQYVWAWGVYFAVQWVRTVRLTSRLANAAGFRVAFNAGVIGCTVFYLLLLPSPWLTHNPLVCPLFLIVSEVVIFFSLTEKAEVLVAQIN
jgi:hypothetical protein